MEIEEIRSTLELYNEKVEKLERLSFTQLVRTAKTGIKISSQRTGDESFETTVERKGPEPEAVEAFLLTFRLFVQTNEKISVSGLAQIYAESSFSPDLAERFTQTRDVLNSYLDEPHEIRFTEKEKILTRREMMLMFLYGDLAHTNNAEHRERFLRWTSGSEINLEVAFNEFIVIISRVFIVLRRIRNINQKVLAELGSDQ